MLNLLFSTFNREVEGAFFVRFNFDRTNTEQNRGIKKANQLNINRLAILFVVPPGLRKVLQYLSNVIEINI